MPRYDQPPPLPPPVTYQPRPVDRNQPVLVPANPYHTAEIPDWLQVYARAPLKWVLMGGGNAARCVGYSAPRDAGEKWPHFYGCLTSSKANECLELRLVGNGRSRNNVLSNTSQIPVMVTQISSPLRQVWPHLEVGVVPAGRPGHVSGHAEAAFHEGARTHRQILRGVPAGAAVRGGGSQTAAAVVRPAAQQELRWEHVSVCVGACVQQGTSRCHSSLRSPQLGSGQGFPFWNHNGLLIASSPNTSVPSLDPNISARKSRHTFEGPVPLPPEWPCDWKKLQWRRITYNVLQLGKLWCHLQPRELNRWSEFCF